MWDSVLFLPCQSRKQKTYRWRTAINIREIIYNGKCVDTMDPCMLTMTLQIEMYVCRIAERFASGQGWPGDSEGAFHVCQWKSA